MTTKFSTAAAVMMTLAAPAAALACEMHEETATSATAMPVTRAAVSSSGAGAIGTASAPLQLAQAVAPTAGDAMGGSATPADATTTPTAAGMAVAGPLSITGAYARSSNPQTGAVFMSIANAGSSACTLAAARTPAAKRAELHTHRDEAGVMKMLQIDSIEIPAGGHHDLARGGDHIMLMEMPAPLAEGDEVALTLDFGACGTVPLTVLVEPAAGTAPAHHGANHDAHHGAAAADAPAN